MVISSGATGTIVGSEEYPSGLYVSGVTLRNDGTLTVEREIRAGQPRASSMRGRWSSMVKAKTAV